MKITALIIGTLMFGGVMLGVAQLYGGVQLSYAPGGTANSTVFSEYNETAMRMNATISKIEGSMTRIGEKGFGDIIGTVVESSVLFLDMAGLFMEIPNIVITFINQSFGFLDILGDVKWFIIIATSSVVVVVVMRVVAMVMKSEEP